jgi:NAD(P)-dependent dehydrogenase (short-subunit alcohol dehydrogenase family)
VAQVTKPAPAKPFTASDIPDLTGRTYLVTGANSGLGLVTATELSRHGGRVLMAGRNPAKLGAAMATVRAAGGPEPEAIVVDLADLGSVRRAAEDVRSRVDVLHVLVNNAGVMAVPFGRTVDGFELQIATNHLGHFALTGLLLPLLPTHDPSADARVISVSSHAHRIGKVDPDDLCYSTRKYTAWGAYGQSKAANLLFTAELARRAQASGRHLIAAAAHPGYSATNLTASGPAAGKPRIAIAFTQVMDRIIGQSAQQGALPQLLAATGASVTTNDFYGPARFGESRGHPKLVDRTDHVKDLDLARRLWERSEALTGVSYLDG